MIAIIDYGMGNLASVYKAMLYIGQDAMITANPADLMKADAVILPGVGAMSTAMMNLQAAGLQDALYEVVEKQKPLLGICLGMQMLFETSQEGATSFENPISAICDSKDTNPLNPDSGDAEIVNIGKIVPQQSSLVKGLGILKGGVIKLPAFPDIKIPHMGWNQLIETKGNLYKEGKSVYFVHSYCASPQDPSIITAKAFHGIKFAASVESGSITAMQFHPEKSGDVGLDILRSWVGTF